MKNSTKIWGLIGAAAMIAPVALSTPALADGGASIGNSEINNSAYSANVDKMKNKRNMGAKRATLARMLAWHDLMLNANALDHTPASGVAGDQQGPVRNSRAFAIVQIAVYDAVNAFDNKFESFSSGIDRAPRGASRDAAIAQAAFTTLTAMYPRQASIFAVEFSADLSAMNGSASSIAAGRAVGLQAANAILVARATDGAGAAGTPAAVPFGNGVGAVGSGSLNVFGEQVNGGQTAAPRWAPDPFPFLDGVVPAIRNVALGANWGSVTPFVLTRGDQFRIPNYPAVGSDRFRAAYFDVEAVGADPVAFPESTGTAATQFIGNFWGYDGAPLLGTPPRLYAQIAVEIANSEGLKDVNDYARLLALVHTTQGDSGVAAWDSKWFHNFWRPATGVPGGNAEGTPGVTGNPDWRPFGASVVNLSIPEKFTPPFPAYPSGHATFGAAVFRVLADFFGDNTRFTFVSDEYNGLGVDPRRPAGSQIRPFVPVRFRTLMDAQQENGRSRIFNGVHWEPDDTEGQNLGTNITRYILANEFRPIKKNK